MRLGTDAVADNCRSDGSSLFHRLSRTLFHRLSRSLSIRVSHTIGLLSPVQAAMQCGVMPWGRCAGAGVRGPVCGGRCAGRLSGPVCGGGFESQQLIAVTSLVMVQASESEGHPAIKRGGPALNIKRRKPHFFEGLTREGKASRHRRSRAGRRRSRAEVLEARMLLAAHLTLQLDVTTVSEGAGVAAITATLARVEAPSVTAALDVAISVDDADELFFPSTVTIPANATETTFSIDTINDAVIDVAALVVMTAAASGFDPAMVSVTVTDDDTATDKIIGGRLSGSFPSDTYTISHDLVVPADRVMTLAAGSTLLFPAGQGIDVEGTLTAVGDTSNAITFGSSSATPTAGDWTGVTISSDTGQTATELAHVLIEYATTGVDVTGNNAGVTIRDSEVRNNSETGVFLNDDNGQSIDVRDNHIHGNAIHGIHVAASDSLCSGIATPITIEANDIDANTMSGIYLRAAATTGCGLTTSPAILGNRVHGNETGIVGAAVNSGGRVAKLAARMENNFVYNQQKEGLNFSAIPAGTGFISEMRNNTVINNGGDGILHSTDTGPEFRLLNNIVQGNARGVVADAAYTPDAGSVGFNNVFGSQGQDWVEYPTAYGLLDSTNANGTPADASANVSVDSGFAADGFHLLIGSPLLGAGEPGTPVVPDVDFDGGPRANPPDIGADEAQKLVMTFIPADPNDVVPRIDELDGMLTVTLMRAGAETGNPLTVTLTNSDTSEAMVPDTVTIPANATSTSFQVKAVDDFLNDDDQIAVITAAATGYRSDFLQVEVVDDEAATFIVTVPPATSISENGGSVQAVLTRNLDTTDALVVPLSSSNSNAASVPNSVTIPAGSRTATFLVTGVDDGLVAGDRQVVIRADSSLPSISATVTVLDDDIPQLTVTPSGNAVAEGQALQATVSRNTPATSSLTVMLATTDSGEATVPNTVTIPFGQLSTTFTINGVNDLVLDGDQAVEIRATHALHATGSANVTVTDIQVPELSLSIVNSVIREGGAATTAVVSRNTSTTDPLVVTLSTSDDGQATVPATVTIPAGSEMVSFAVNPVDDAIVDGNQTIQIIGQATGLASASIDVTVNDNDVATLTLSIADVSISEDGGVTEATIVRNTDTTADLTVQLLSVNPSRATTPSSVVIPAGQTSQTFQIVAVDDSIANGDADVAIRAKSSGFVDGLATVTVLDDETPQLTVTPSGNAVAEGQALQATVSRNTPATSSLTVILATTDSGEATVPNTVTIPFGQLSTTFTIDGVNDMVLDGDQAVEIRATHALHATGSANVTVTDIQVPELSLSIVNSVIREGGAATTAVVSRNTSTTDPLVVTLSTSDDNQATVPATVTIPAGSEMVSFAVNPVDDAIVDGNQTIQIIGQATGLASASIDVTVNDNDVATLTLSIADVSISEDGGVTEATIVRNTDTTADLTVQLLSVNPSRATTPSSVVIPAGQTSQTFQIVAVDDSIANGDADVAIRAESSGFVDGLATITIADDESARLTLTLDSTAVSEGQAATGTVTRNTATQSPITVMLSVDDATEASVPSTVTIAAGQASATFTIAALTDQIVDGAQTVAVSAAHQLHQTGAAVLTVNDIDVASLSVSLVDSRLSEGGPGTTAQVVRNTAATDPLVVTLSTSDDSEATVPATITIPAGETSASFTVTAVDDPDFDGDQVIDVVAQATGHTVGTAVVTIIDDEVPVIIASLASASIDENGGSTVATITRSGDTSSSLLVQISTDVTGKVMTADSVTIPIGQASATFAITSIDDSISDGNTPVMIRGTATGFADAISTLLVIEDDVASLSLVFDATEIAESGETMATVSRNTPATGPLAVTLVSSDPERVLVPASVTIPAGNFSTTFPVTSIDDSIAAGGAGVSITANASQHLEAQSTLTVNDDETPMLTFVVDATEIGEADGITIGRVTRNTPTTDNLPITLTLTGPAAIELPETVTILASETTATFEISALNDDLALGDRTATISVQSPGLASTDATLTVVDDEQPMLDLSVQDDSIAENGGQTTVRIDRNTVAPLTVMISSTDDERLASPLSIQFDADQRFAEFTVSAIDDIFVNGDANISLSVSATGHAGQSASVDVVDNEVASFEIQTETLPPLTASEPSSAASFDVVLGAAPVSDVVLQVAGFDASQLSASVTTFVFTPDDWDQPQSVSLTAIDDDLVEPSLEFAIEVSIVEAQSHSAFAGLQPQMISLSLLDDDVAGIVIEATDGSTFVSETRLSDSFNIHLAGAPLSPVTLLINAVDLPGVTLDPASITFDRDNWDAPQLITVQTSADFDVDRTTLGHLEVLIGNSTTAFGFSSLDEPIVDLLLVDNVTQDLRLTNEAGLVLFLDADSGAVLRTIDPVSSGGLTTGSRSESILVDPALVIADDAVLDLAGGDDTIGVSNAAVKTIDGGDGFDTLRILGADSVIDLSGQGLTLQRFEMLDLSDAEAQSLSLDPAAVAGIVGDSGTLVISAGDQDTINVGSGWQAGPTRVAGAVTFHQLVSGDLLLELSNQRPWTNPLVAADVDRSGAVTSLDALRIINRLGRQGDEKELPVPTESDPVVDYYDVSRDGNATALDALQVINFIGRMRGSESEDASQLPQAVGSFVASIVRDDANTPTENASTVVIASVDRIAQFGDSLADAQPAQKAAFADTVDADDLTREDGEADADELVRLDKTLTAQH